MNLIIIIIALLFATTIAIVSSIPLSLRSAEALVDMGEFRKAPIAISGENIYTAWWTNNTANGNDEVMFRASTDGGVIFGDKINLSNTTEADSNRVEIAADGENVVVSWWETNQTDDTPLARVSTDNGATFGPFVRLANNGTIGGSEE
jgi:hypothetical protein